MSKPLLVLLAEDILLIALDLQDDLEFSGFEVAGPFTSSSGALDWLKHASPDLALIDNLLDDGASCDLGRELHRRDIPFAVYSGLQRHLSDPRWNDIPNIVWINKPVPFHHLLLALGKLIPMRQPVKLDRVAVEVFDSRMRTSPIPEAA